MHQPAHTVATLRQLNHHNAQQIEDLKRQLKTQSQAHKRALAHTTQNGVDSVDNLRAIIVDHKETITRLERELVEKSKRAVTHAHDLEHVRYAHEQELKALRTRSNDKVRLARERAQEQYDELCADYREYQLKSKAEFMALFNDYEAYVKGKKERKRKEKRGEVRRVTICFFVFFITEIIHKNKYLYKFKKQHAAFLCMVTLGRFFFKINILKKKKYVFKIRQKLK